MMKVKSSVLKKSLLLFLCLCLVLPMAFGCSGEDTDNSTDGSNGSEGESVENTVFTGGLFNGYVPSEEGKSGITDNSVIVVQMNGVSAAMLGEYEGQAIMPNLSGFASKALAFTDFFSQQDMYENEYSALNSLYAPIQTVLTEEYINGTYYSLAKLFADNGYKTEAFLPDYSKSLESGIFGAYGFENAVGAESDEALYSAAVDALGDGTEKKLVFVSTASVKYPYIIEKDGPLEIKENLSLSAYLNAVSAADASFATLISLLDSKFSEGNKPTVVVYGTAPELDAKASVMAKDYPQFFGISYNTEDAHKAPFIISAEGQSADEINAFTTVYDIYPTLANIYGFDGAKMVVCGENAYYRLPTPERTEIVAAENYALGASYTVSSYGGGKASYRLGQKDDGKKLTDGKTVNVNAAESDTLVAAKGGGSSFEYLIDLGEVRSIETVKINDVAKDGTMYGGTDPDTITVSLSNDGANFTQVSHDLSYKVDDNYDKFTSYDCVLKNIEKARYVKISMTAVLSLLTVSEIQVMGREELEEASEESTESEADEDKRVRFIALQGDSPRGTLITENILYTLPNNIPYVFDRFTLEELRSKDYKGIKNEALALINECEQLVLKNVLAGDGLEASVEAFYAGIPSVDDLVISREDSVNNSGSFASEGALLARHALIYKGSEFKGVWEGLSLDGSSVVLEDGVDKGSLMTEEFNVGEFSKLLTSINSASNGGKIKLKLSFAKENGIFTKWNDLFTWSGTASVAGSLDEKCEGYSVESGVISIDGGKVSGRVRLMLELERSEDGASPVLNSVTFASDGIVSISPELVADDYRTVPLEAFVAISDANNSESVTDTSGPVAVAALIADGTGKEAEIPSAVSMCYDTLADRYSNLALLAAYSCESGIDAFADLYTADDLKITLQIPQQIICKTVDDKFIIVYGFDEIGFKVLDPQTGETYVLTEEELSAQWKGEVLVMDSYINVPEIIEAIIPENSVIRPGEVVDQKKFIVVHNTGNYSPGSSALSHANYLMGQTTTADREASWHYTVDHKEIYHHIPDNENAWHASDGSYGDGNYYGIGIEICVSGFPGVYTGEEYENWKNTFLKSCNNAAYLVAKLLVENGLGMDAVKQHYDFAPNKKNCPMQMRYTSASESFTRDDGDIWKIFIKDVERIYNKMLSEKNAESN